MYCGITGWFPLPCPVWVCLCLRAKVENRLVSHLFRKHCFCWPRKQAGGQIFLSKISSCTICLRPGMRLTCVHNISIHLSSPPSETTHLRIIFLIDCTSSICLVLFFLNAPPCSVVYSQATYELTHLLYAEKSELMMNTSSVKLFRRGKLHGHYKPVAWKSLGKHHVSQWTELQVGTFSF